jgi:hypothetical protein
MKKYNQEKYVKFLRFSAFCVVLFLWGLSVWWSADGFSIRRSDLRWVGLGLALSVTVAQLVFNRGAINPTLFIVGIAAYIYGIGTNMSGINTVLRIDLSINAWTTMPFATFVDGLIVVGLALVVEIFPESLLLWAIYPELRSPGDFISTLAGGMNIENRPQNRPNLSDTNKITSENEQTSSSERTNVRNRTNQLTNLQTNPFIRLNWSEIPEKKKQILGYAKNQFERTGKIPGPTEVSRKLYNGKSRNKGFVSQTYKEYKIFLI